ncbi:MAG: hypothetical protein GC152_08195 [Alphaproteobacteria bacterium]|nr:hypothetical protein [Alphaproteobacteria bacterium]
MRVLIHVIAALGVVMFLTPRADARPVAFATDAIVCASTVDGAAPDFDDPACRSSSIYRVDPQGREIWARLTVMLDAAALESGEQLGLFIAGKASSEIYVNGVRVGANGAPAATRAAEVPGLMDANIPLPAGVARAGENIVVLRLSGHHSLIRLRSPMHAVAIGPYETFTASAFAHYWPSLIPFGALIAGAFYFAVAAASGGWRRDQIFLAALSLLAAGQLVAEVWRGLAPYAYPKHDVRLLLIVALSSSFGLSLAARTAFEFLEKGRWPAIGAAAAATIAGAAFMPGFDGKALAGMLAPTAVATIIAAIAAFRGGRRGEPETIAGATVLAAFTASIILTRTMFLDAFFFFEVAALMLALFAVEARAHERERVRSADLERALQRAKEAREPLTVKVATQGGVEFIPTSEISHVSGAGDYVEIHLLDGRQRLHNATLSKLEAELPATFLRVHRSHIVNADHVRSLSREASGVGSLELSTGASVPVSRRVMPAVRGALAG